MGRGFWAGGAEVLKSRIWAPFDKFRVLVYEGIVVPLEEDFKRFM